MKPQIKFLFLFLFLLIGNIVLSQNCLKCDDTKYENSYDFNLLNSQYHLLQLYGDISNHSTNFYKEKYSGNVGWIESRLIVPYLSKLIDSRIPLPDPFLTGSIKGLKDIYWENRFDYGAGIEWRLFKNIKKNIVGFNWIKHLRFYVLYLNTEYLQDIESWRPITDFRYGFELYRECNIYSKINSNNNKDNILWSEFWADFSYRKTNFFINNYNSWIFAFAPKIGVKFFPNKFYSLMPYLTGELLISGRTEFWQNRALLGLGFRLMPFRNFSKGKLSIISRSLRFYCEYFNSIKYFKDKATNITPKNDLKFGITFSVFR